MTGKSNARSPRDFAMLLRIKPESFSNKSFRYWSTLRSMLRSIKRERGFDGKVLINRSRFLLAVDTFRRAIAFGFAFTFALSFSSSWPLFVEYQKKVDTQLSLCIDSRMVEVMSLDRNSFRKENVKKQTRYERSVNKHSPHQTRLRSFVCFSSTQTEKHFN